MEQAMKRLPWFLLTPALFLLLTAPSNGVAHPPYQPTGPAADTINFRAFAVEIAARELEAGEMDMYLFSLKTPSAEKLKTNPNATVYEAPASTLSIVLNPAPAPDGELNPLSIKEVRQALQHVVNRPFIAQEIYKGFALPMFTHVSPTDFDYLTVYDLLKESNIGYDPQLAKDMVTEAMTQAGAELQNGVWHYNGRRIDLKFIVRTEDERWDIGNTLRAALVELGFSVNLLPQQFGPAIYTVYGTDPQQFGWHLYTEGWGRGAPERYDFASINQMCAPWLGNMPGWQEVGFWQYQAPQIDDLGQRIFTGDFTNIEERNQIYAQATEACMGESVRLWVVTAINNFPARADIQGVTQDVVAGPKGLWTLREANVAGKTDLTVGNLWVWPPGGRSTWNPVGGFGDVYSVDIWNTIHDPPMWTHPFTGIPIPFRAQYQVETAGPGGKLGLPGDAFAWNADAGRWSAVPSGTQATSKVIFDYSKYFQSKWHDGQPITMADVLYPISQLFDMVYNEDKSKIEFSISATSKPFVDTFRGFRITSDNMLEVYVDFWHFLPDYIAQYANISGVSMPWEVLAAMDELVFQQGTAAYSDTTAARYNVPWLSLVMDRDSRLVRNALRDLADTGFVPENVFTVNGESLVSETEAASRYSSAIDWFARKGHMVISNGAYALERFDSSAQFAQVKAFRDPGYPFHAGDLYYGDPPTIEITSIEKGSLQKGADMTTTVEVDGPGELTVQYVLQDPATGQIVESGTAEALSASLFQVRVPSQEVTDLNGDLYHLFLAVYSDQLSSLLERKLDIEAAGAGQGPQPSPMPGPGATDTAIPSEGDGGVISIGLIIVIVLGVAAAIGTGLLFIVMRSSRRAG
jgi:peptide/nickel transport system substrate-binding protein